MNPRDYQPSLLWAKVISWYEQNQENPRPIGPHDVQVYIYRTDEPGAWYLHGPKLYWTDKPMGEYFQNTDQDDLVDHADQLGEVVLWDRRARKTILVGKTFEEAVRKISS